jgi:hypothetical protein
MARCWRSVAPAPFTYSALIKETRAVTTAQKRTESHSPCHDCRRHLRAAAHGRRPGTAQKVGEVHVDVGDTSCKVPYAPAYIEKPGKRALSGRSAKRQSAEPGRLFATGRKRPLVHLQAFCCKSSYGKSPATSKHIHKCLAQLYLQHENKVIKARTCLASYLSDNAPSGPKRSRPDPLD